MRDRTRLETQLETFSGLEAELNDNLELLEMAEEEGDAAIATEAEAADSSFALAKMRN